MPRLVLLGLLCLAPLLALASCGNQAPAPRGRCEPYNGICASVVGNSIWVNDSFPIDAQDAVITDLLTVLRQQKGLVSTECSKASDWFACAEIIQPCIEAGGGEGIPLLPCSADCGDWWAVCGDPFDKLYLQAYLHNDPTQSAVVMCDNGGLYQSLLSDPNVVPDRFGGRAFPLNSFWPLGYNGTLRFPDSTADYTLSNGSVVTTQCYHPVRPAADLVLAHNVTCVAPLTDGLSWEGAASCIIPCPFPVYSPDEISSVLLAFTVPGCMALGLAVFVLLDSLWVLFEYTGGFQLRRLRKYMLWSSGEASSSTGGGGGVKDSGSHAPYGRPRPRPVRATTLYSIAGALLSIVYFLVGPLPSLVRANSVACGGATGMPIADLTSGQSLGDSMCTAQRYSPFVLQLLFNLILYTIVKVYEVVSDQYKRLPGRTQTSLAVALALYCFGVPIVFLIASAVLDHTPTDLNAVLEVMVREASICIMRFDSKDVEFTLLYLPFILTGALTTVLAALVFRDIRRVRDKVAGTYTAKNAETEKAFKQLMLRLCVLGLGTFAVLIVVMVSTSVYSAQVHQFAPLWIYWSECVQTAFSCDLDACAPLLDNANVYRPTAAVMGAQLASMSCIALLFGSFFALQSAARLSKEYNNGQLREKWRRLVLGGGVSTSRVATGTGVPQSPAGHTGGTADTRTDIKASFNNGTRVDTVAAYQNE